jgi:hypothetical protein
VTAKNLPPTGLTVGVQVDGHRPPSPRSEEQKDARTDIGSRGGCRGHERALGEDLARRAHAVRDGQGPDLEDPDRPVRRGRAIIRSKLRRILPRSASGRCRLYEILRINSRSCARMLLTSLAMSRPLPPRAVRARRRRFESAAQRHHDRPDSLRLRASWGARRVELAAVGTPAIVVALIAATAIAVVLWLR